MRDIKTCLTLIGWTNRHVATELTMNERQVRRWIAGEDVPDRVLKWLNVLADYHEQHPPPDKE